MNGKICVLSWFCLCASPGAVKLKEASLKSSAHLEMTTAASIDAMMHNIKVLSNLSVLLQKVAGGPEGSGGHVRWETLDDEKREVLNDGKRKDILPVTRTVTAVHPGSVNAETIEKK